MNIQNICEQLPIGGHVLVWLFWGAYILVHDYFWGKTQYGSFLNFLKAKING